MVTDLYASDVSGISIDQWLLGAGASKVAAVQTNDGDTSYIRSGTTNNGQQFNVAWPTGIAAVNSLTAKGYAKYVTTSGWHSGVGCYLAGVGADISNDVLTNAYALYTRTCVRPGGGSWSASDCRSGVTYLYVSTYTSPGGGNVYCTQLWFTLDYTPASGGFNFIIGSLIGPLLGSALLLSQMPEIRAAYNRAAIRARIHSRMMPSDDQAAFNDLKYDPHRKFYLPSRLAA